MGIIDGRFTKKNNGILSYLTNQQDQDYYEYEQLKKRQTSPQKQNSHHGLFPQPSIQRPPQVSGNASAFACLAIAIIKITGLAAVAIASAL